MIKMLESLIYEREIVWAAYLNFLATHKRSMEEKYNLHSWFLGIYGKLTNEIRILQGMKI